MLSRICYLWECISTFRGSILVIIHNNSSFINYISQLKIPLFIEYYSLCLFDFLLYVTARAEIKYLFLNCKNKQKYTPPYGHMRLSVSFPYWRIPLIFRMKWTESQLLFPTIIRPGKAIKRGRGKRPQMNW